MLEFNGHDMAQHDSRVTQQINWLLSVLRILIKPSWPSNHSSNNCMNLENRYS